MGRRDRYAAALETARIVRTYIVKSGDTLTKIAREQLGNPMAFVDIFHANAERLSYSSMVTPGQILNLPEVTKA